MRHGCLWLIAAAIVTIASPSREAAADGEKGREASITIIGSPSLIPEGIRCTIELKPEANDRETVETTYEGRVTQATDEGIMLAVTEERRCVSKDSPVAKLPYLNRLSRNIGIRKPKPGEEETVSIPVEKIRSVRCLGNVGE